MTDLTPQPFHLAAGGGDLARFRRRNAWLLWSVGLFSCAVNLLLLTGPVYMLQVYDRVLGSGSRETLLTLSLLVAFLFLLMGCLDFARGRIGARFGARLQEETQGSVFRAALARARRTGEAQGGLRDLAAVQRLTAAPVFMALFDLPWTPLFIAAIFVFHPWLGWLALGGGVALVAITAVNQRVSADPIAAAGQAAQRADHLAADMQGEAELIQSLGMRGAAFDRWQRLRAAALDAGMRAADQVGGFTTLTRTLRLFLQSAILGLGAFLVLENELTAGAMIAGSILLGRALAPVELAIGQWSAIAEAHQAWRRLRGLLREDPDDRSRMALPRPRAALDISNLAVTPPGAERPVLRGVSMRVAPGTAVGVIGPSGAGKSTLARAITGAWAPTAGQVRLDRATLDHYHPDTLGRLIGYLPQSVTLFDGTIAENIARLDADFDGAAVVAAARKAAAHEAILSLPDGYDTRVTGLGAQLSGGQVQRIGLARALYGDPVLVILDEPNSALDNDGSEALNRAVRDLKAAGRAVLIMTHRPSAIAECDRLLVLKDGRQQGSGPTVEVMQTFVRNAASLIDAPGAGGMT